MVSTPHLIKYLEGKSKIISTLSVFGDLAYLEKKENCLDFWVFRPAWIFCDFLAATIAAVVVEIAARHHPVLAAAVVEVISCLRAAPAVSVCA